MKTLLIVSSAFGVAAIGGLVWHHACTQSWCPLENAPASKAAPLASAPSPRTAPAPSRPPAPAAPAKPAANAALPPADAAMAHQLATDLDAVTSAKTSFGAKMAIWDRLRTSGKIDEALNTLKRLALDDPSDPEVAVALAEAEYQELRQIAEAGAPFNERAILALQADQDFDAALKLDPTNWEAQFQKASALCHWPANLNKGPEVVQRLTALIAQQQTMPPQPEFAATYLVLAQQYQSAGDAAKAAATLQQGLAQFPANATLQQKLATLAGP